MLHSNYWIVGRWLELHTLTSVDLAVQIKRTTLSKDCNTRTGLHFKNVSTFPSKRLWLQPLTWTLCRNKMKFLIKDLIIALEISLLSSIPRGEETLNFKVSNFLPKKKQKRTLLLGNECSTFGRKKCAALSPQLSTIYSALGKPEAPAWLSSSDMRTHFFSWQYISENIKSAWVEIFIPIPTLSIQRKTKTCDFCRTLEPHLTNIEINR